MPDMSLMEDQLTAIKNAINLLDNAHDIFQMVVDGNCNSAYQAVKELKGHCDVLCLYINRVLKGGD